MLRYDREIAPTYDDHWSDIPPSHGDFVARMLDFVPDGGVVLDAGCGTGRMWPLILDTGRRVFGVDQSEGMLDVARRKHPEVGTERCALQDLGFHGEFDAVICVDAMENVGPEDWLTVLGRLGAAVKTSAPMYLTVELPEDDDPYLSPGAPHFGQPIVTGESFDGIGYHYFPDADLVRGWLAQCGFDVVAELEADGYLHVLARAAAGDGEA